MPLPPPQSSFQNSENSHPPRALSSKMRRKAGNEIVLAVSGRWILIWQKKRPMLHLPWGRGRKYARERVKRISDELVERIDTGVEASRVFAPPSAKRKFPSPCIYPANNKKEISDFFFAVAVARRTFDNQM